MFKSHGVRPMGALGKSRGWMRQRDEYLLGVHVRVRSVSGFFVGRREPLHAHCALVFRGVPHHAHPRGGNCRRDDGLLLETRVSETVRMQTTSRDAAHAAHGEQSIRQSEKAEWSHDWKSRGGGGGGGSNAIRSRVSDDAANAGGHEPRRVRQRRLVRCLV